MERLGLFVLLVILIPATVFWAGQRFRSADQAWEEFASQVNQLRGFHVPEPEPEPPPPKEKEDPEPKREPAEKPPQNDEPAPATTPQELYDAGRFADAARGFDKTDERMAAIARFAETLKEAFPTSIPPGEYLKVTTKDGAKYEGFAETSGSTIRLRRISGLEAPLPKDRIASQVELPRDHAIKQLLRRLKAESGGAEGPRLFALTQQAFLLGEPAAAAPLVVKVLGKDADNGFLAAAIEARVPAPFRDRVLQAYAAVPSKKEVVVHDTRPVAKTPIRLGNGKSTRKPKQIVSDPEARRLVATAARHRQKADKIFDAIAATILAKGRSGLDSADIKASIDEFEKAIAIYQKVRKIEESDGVEALVSYCSHRVATLHATELAMDGH